MLNRTAPDSVFGKPVEAEAGAHGLGRFMPGAVVHPCCFLPLTIHSPTFKLFRMRKAAKFRAGIATFALALSVVGVVGTASSALAKCEPYRANDNKSWFDGWYRNSGRANVGGIEAGILNYSPWVYPNDGSGVGVSAWTMLTGSGSGLRWAQIGWVEYPYGVRHTFVQWTNSAGNNWTTHFYTAQPVGATTTYTVLYNNTPGDFTFEAGSINDTEQATFTPSGSQNFGEIATLASQMPGGYNYFEEFTNAHIYVTGIGWEPYSGTTDNYSSTYFGNYQSGSEVDGIWDQSCST